MILVLSSVQIQIFLLSNKGSIYFIRRDDSLFGHCRENPSLYGLVILAVSKSCVKSGFYWQLHNTPVELQEEQVLQRPYHHWRDDCFKGLYFFGYFHPLDEPCLSSAQVHSPRGRILSILAVAGQVNVYAASYLTLRQSTALKSSYDKVKYKLARFPAVYIIRHFIVHLDSNQGLLDTSLNTARPKRPRALPVLGF